MEAILTDGGRSKEGFKTEHNDCTVRAAVVRFCTSYKLAHDWIEKAGRKAGGSLTSYKVLDFLKSKGLAVFHTRCTVGRFLKEHPRGRWYVIIGGHAFGVNQGKIVDEFNAVGGKCRVYWYA